MKKNFLLIILFFFSLHHNALLAQTKIIAHKSHSGKISTFSFAGKDNFGIGPIIIDSIIKTSDTTVIQFMDYDGSKYIDTTYHHDLFHNPEIGLDSLIKMYPNRVKFIGFEKENNQKKEQKTTPQIQNKDGSNGLFNLTVLLILLFLALTISIYQSNKTSYSFAENR